MIKITIRCLQIVGRNTVEYFKKSGIWGVAEQTVAVLRALLLAASILVTQQLFDAIVDLAGSGESGFRAIAYQLLLLTVVIVAQQLASGASQYLLSKVSYTNMGKFMSDFQRKLGRLSPVLFEDTEFLDQTEKAKECLEYESLGHFASICVQLITYYLVYLIAVGGYLFSLSPILLLIVAISFIPALAGQVIKAKCYFDLEDEIAPLHRQCDYYKRTITDIRFFKETRLLGAYSFFYQHYLAALKQVTQKRWNLEKKMAVLYLLLGGASFLGLALAILVLFNSTMSGQISVGVFLAVFIAISDVFALIDELVSFHLGDASEVLAQVTNFYRLMDLPEVEASSAAPDFTQGIQIKDATFTYPGNVKSTIRNLSLNIQPGETVALVGENGSGKTTLVKLLTGQYVPQIGTVTIGGIVCDSRAKEAPVKNISAVFQNYQRYKMTLAENVAISNTEQQMDRDKIQASLVQANFDQSVVDLDDTILSPEFNGLDLSGGQWQRVSIARGLYREHNFIVLDEPTSAIDPIEESQVFQRFQALVQNCTAVIVTHRLGSARFADRIIVLDKGEIAEEGTHDALLSQRGKYAQMWKSQASWYHASNPVD